jgi:hypothetical protein
VNDLPALEREGNNSMSVKQGTKEDVYIVALQHLSDMVKAIIA